MNCYVTVISSNIQIKEVTMTLSELCQTLQKEITSGKFFWRSNPPIEYSSGLLFKGINFAILGLNKLNELENRWITEGDRQLNHFNLKTNCGKAEKILIFTKNHPDFVHGTLENSLDTWMFSVEAWNTSQLNAGIPPMSEPKKTLSEIIPLIKIPFATPTGIGYFDIQKKLKEQRDKFSPKEKMGINPLEVLRKLCYQKLPEIKTSTYEDNIPGSSDQVYEDLTVELASCRIATTLGCMLTIDDYAAHIKASFEKLNLKSASAQLKILRAFADASTLEEYLLYEQDTPDELKDYELIEPFVSKKEWQQIIESETNTAAWSLIIDNLLQNASECRKANSNDIAYLRYLCVLPEQELEFYATSLTADGEISGILKTKQGNLQITLNPESLHNTFTLEITHKPVVVPKLEKK